MRTLLQRSIYILLSVFLIFACTQKQEYKGKFGSVPENAKAGDEITIYYNPDSTDLKGKENIKCVAFFYNNELIDAVDVPLQREGDYLSAKLKTDENSYGVLFKFTTDDAIDNNNAAGYKIFFTDNEGNKLPGSIAGLAAAYNRWGAYYLDLDRDKDKALALFTKDFEQNPELKSQFFVPYFEVVYSVRIDDREKIIGSELQKLEKKTQLDEKELELLAEWYAKIGMVNKAEKYETELEKKYPGSEFVLNKKYLEFRAEKDVNKKIETVKNFEKQFPDYKNLQLMYDLVANAYRDAKEYQSALEFFKNNINKTSTFRFYSVVKRILDEKSDMKIAEQISQLGIERCRKEIDNPSGKKPEYLSQREWKEEREYYLGINLYVYGMVLYEMNQISESLVPLVEAVALTRKKEGDINELYSKVLIESGKYDIAMDQISEFIKAGNSTAIMKDLLKEAYLNKKGSDEGFVSYAAQFEDAAHEKLVEKYKKEMILEPAPSFTLTDLNGNEVSLSEYKGKTVIVDFWATWCGPCLASFPGMKKAVEKYQDDKNVKFFFINTWERVDDKKKNASEFIAKNDYPFHVLMDDESIVIEQFKVSGIPTKFIIDGQGNIRFKSVGYQGTEDQLVEELSVMIALAN